MAIRQIHSSKGMSSDQWLHQFREVMMDTYFPLRIAYRKPPIIVNEVRSLQCANILVASHVHDNVTIQRGRPGTHNDSDEYFVFLFQCAGSGRVSSCRGEIDLSAGSVCVCNSSAPHIYETGDYSRNITVTVSCETLRARVRGIDDFAGRADFANPLLVPVARKLAAQFLMFDIPNNSEALERALVDILGVMADSPHASQIELPPRKLLSTTLSEKVVDYMRDNLSDSDLSPGSVAAGMRISVSYVHKLFRSRGNTFGQTLTEMRLTEAQRLLASPVQAGARLSICDIALACGFSSQAHFSTRFRERFGITPRSALQSSGSRRPS